MSHNYSCTHPLKGFQIGFTENGKPDYLICSRKVHHIEKIGKVWEKVYDEFVSPRAIGAVFVNTPIPCGKCIQCRIAYSRQWAIRCLEEAKYSKYSYFVTLTYDNEHLPFNSLPVFDDETGEIIGDYTHSTLRKEDLTTFFKDLRYAFWKYAGEPRKDNGKPDYSECSFRYFACGEYGTDPKKTHRPHFHFLLFSDLQLDLIEVGSRRNARNKRTYKYYSNPILDSVWTDRNGRQKGMVRIGECNFDTAAYVARYVVKKRKGKDANYYDDHNIIPEYVVMSRRPGIGYQFYKDNKDSIYTFDRVLVNHNDNVLSVKPPKFYDKMFDLDNPDQMEFIKETRKKVGMATRALELSKTDLSEEEYDLMREETLNNKLRCLERRLQ